MEPLQRAVKALRGEVTLLTNELSDDEEEAALAEAARREERGARARALRRRIEAAGAAPATRPPPAEVLDSSATSATRKEKAGARKKDASLSSANVPVTVDARGEVSIDNRRVTSSDKRESLNIHMGQLMMLEDVCARIVELWAQP